MGSNWACKGKERTKHGFKRGMTITISPLSPVFCCFLVLGFWSWLELYLVVAAAAATGEEICNHVAGWYHQQASIGSMFAAAAAASSTPWSQQVSDTK